MKMLQGSAQTLPLWVGNPEEKAPPLCGAVPAEPSYVAKVTYHHGTHRLHLNLAQA